MKGVSWGLIIGITIGVIIGLCLAVLALLCVRYRRRRAQISSSSSRRNSTIPIRINGVDASTILSDSTIGQDSPKHVDANVMSFWFDGPKRKSLASMSGMPKYSYRDLQKATHNFKTLIGQGAFGPVYKAEMPGGEIVAVKVLAKNSKQGEKEFQTEVLLLGRLHHRNLVNLVGYCTEKGQNMLVYVYMCNGSLAYHLYDLGREPLKWDLRVLIAQDVARGLEYLHDGAVPPVLHRDIKSGNILLDKSMRARVADFGLSREEAVSQRANDIRGTYGYLDPDYVSTRSYTKKSDVYSFGVLLFELITGKNPNQGLLELVDLVMLLSASTFSFDSLLHLHKAALNAEEKGGWEEIVDPRIDRNYDAEELNGMAMLAYKCMNRLPRRRPSMGDIVQTLSRIHKTRQSRGHTPTMSLDTVLEMSQLESQIPKGQLLRGESVDSMAVPAEV